MTAKTTVEELSRARELAKELDVEVEELLGQ